MQKVSRSWGQRSKVTQYTHTKEGQIWQFPKIQSHFSKGICISNVLEMILRIFG